MKPAQLSFTLLILSSVLTVFAADWPQWRGPNRDDVSAEKGLLKNWPEGGPARVWVYTNAGNSYSGPAIVGTKFYTLGTRDGAEIVLALDANTGKELWTASMGDVLANNWGNGPRSTPTVDRGQIFAMSGKGNVVCVNAADGKVLWQKTMASIGGQTPKWGYTESVLVDGDRVVCTPGGSKGAIAALNRKNGEVLWQSADFTDGAQYASIIPAKINGTDTYVQLTMQSIVGIAPKDGKVLWKEAFPGATAVIPTPIVRDNLVYVTAGYGAGCK